VDVLRQALLHANESLLTETIHRMFACALLDVRVAKQIATHLIAVLYQHSSHFGLTMLVAHQSLNEGLAGIHALQTVESVRDYVFRMYQNVTHYLNAQRNPSTEQLVQRILQYIEEHYGDADISTYAIAQKFHLSQSYLCQIYREHTRTSIHATITQKRIDGACERLKQDPHRSIAEIGRHVGYMDAQYFAKVFRRVRGLTPSEYRELATPI
jgi:YesN/AraC family two-component response regulator